MRKCLESRHVSVGLNNWIDLIFGVYAKPQYAIKADNLFLDCLYINSFLAYSEEKDKDKDTLLYFKEFGQVPVSVFHGNHKQIKF